MMSTNTIIIKEPIFEQFVLWLLRTRTTFTITTGIAYGHKIYQQGKYKFIEVDLNKVVIESDDLSYTATTFDELKKFAEAITEKSYED
jgi:hypothetical protein